MKETILLTIVLLLIPSLTLAGEHEATAQAQIARITVTPPKAKLRIGQSYMFRATAYDRNNRPMPFHPVWQTTGGGSISNTGLFKATTKGNFIITAKDKSGDSYGQATVIIGMNQ